ncbi:MAG TPA: GGDEF domain-containing protein [Armatimonadota bacterium]|jgi:diguanylate cyclase (GGDEF)-like protein
MALVHSFLEQPKRLIIAEAYCLLLLLGIIDFVTGPDISMIVFYLLPVMLVAAYVGRTSGLTISFTSAGIWLIADLLGSHRYAHCVIPYWNTLGIFGVFIIVTLSFYALKAALSRERALARVDDVTGMANGRAFQEAVALEMQRTARYKHPFTIAYLDIDDFKAINDTHGHSAGDKLLRTVASTMRGSLRATDVVARLGGDEFAILLPETDAAAATAVMAKLRNVLSAAMEHGPVLLTLSIGVVTCLEAPETLDEILHLADSLMYDGKKSGKNSIIYHVFGDAVVDARANAN